MDTKKLIETFEWLTGILDGIQNNIQDENYIDAVYSLGILRQFCKTSSQEFKYLVARDAEEKESDQTPEDEKKIQLHFADCLRELANIIEQNNQ